MGKPEFSPVHDMHIGIITSSLGGRGGDTCDPAEKSAANMALLAHNDDRGELIIRGGASESPVTDALATGGGGNFLAWFPPVSANMGTGKKPPDVAPLGVGGPGGPTQMGTLVGDFTTMIQGVHAGGCGFEANNEAWYRFLVQPDPYDHIQVSGGNVASLAGVDAILLRQRADFLRPDSAVVVIVVTDENEEAADPLALGGQGWEFSNSQFPGSLTYAAPEGRSSHENPSIRTTRRLRGRTIPSAPRAPSSGTTRTSRRVARMTLRAGPRGFSIRRTTSSTPASSTRSSASASSSDTRRRATCAA
jgi:hypothetical protein